MPIGAFMVNSRNTIDVYAEDALTEESGKSGESDTGPETVYFLTEVTENDLLNVTAEKPSVARIREGDTGYG